MADPLSIAASIAGLISLADRVFLYVFRYARGVAGAKQEVESLSNEINMLSGVLRTLHALASELEAETSFEPTIRMQHLAQCKQTLETIKNRVKKATDDFDNKGKWEGIARRLKWPFSVSETKDLLANISRCKETLTLATSADTMRKLQICLSNQADLGKRLDKKLNNIAQILERDEVDVRKRLVLDFFMKPEANPKANLSQSLRLRHPTTGSWLTLSHSFQTWLETPGSRLWLNGIPGGGKTVLAGAVIEEALSAKSSPDTAIAFFFCDYKSEATLSPINILGSIASQIARQKDDAFDLLQDYYQKLHPVRALDRMADVDEVRAVITKMTDLFSQTIVIIDGLDECGDNTDSVLESVSELATSTTTTSLALFSRDELNIRTWLHDEFEEISIEAHKEDIELFVRAGMEQRIQNNRLRISNLKIKDEITEELITRANGMFRWVVCQLDYLCEFATDADRRNALKELPPTLPDSYRRLLERLNKRPARVQKMVQMSLQFIAFFPSRLPIKALCQAVSTPDVRIDETNTVTEREIILGCSSLIRKSLDGRSLEFAHFSVLEFLQGDLLSNTPGLEAYRLSKPSDCKVLAIQCLKFLQLENFNNLPSSRTEWLRFRGEQLELYPFYLEAAIGWLRLARDGLEDSLLLDAVKSLFQPAMTQSFHGWLEFFLAILNSLIYAQDNNDGISFDRCHFHGTNIALDQNLQPLHVASALNLPEVCSFLIGEGADVDRECSMGTPLLLAELSFLALGDDKSGPINLRSSLIKGLLPSPSCRNRTISCLIEAGASLLELVERETTRSFFLNTCIIDCHIKDFGPTIQLLKQSITPMDSEVDELEAYLKAWTQFYDHWELEKPLLDLVHHLKRSCAYKHDWGLRLGKALWSACSELNFAFTSDPTLTDSRISLSRDALIEKTIVAIRIDDADALRSYLNDERIDVHSSYSCNRFHGTLLHLAIRDDSLACVDQLLESGSDPNSKDDQGRTPVHHCYCHEDGEILKVLIRFGVSPLVKDANGDNLWHYCAWGSWAESFTDVLFNLNENDSWSALLTQNKSGRTPLMIALSHQVHTTEEDREECEWRALMFIEYCNQVPDFWVQHGPLFPAVCKFASSRVLERLKDLGLEPDALMPGQATPLHDLGPETSVEWTEALKRIYPNACNVRFEGRLPLEAYLEAILRSGKRPNNMKDVIQVLASPDTLKLRDQETMPWEFACSLRLQAENWDEQGELFFRHGWRALDMIWANLLTLGAMKAYEDALGQCGLYPLLSALVQPWDLRDNNTIILSDETLDGAIRASCFWNPEEEVVVRFFKQAINDRKLAKVQLMLKHGLNVHQRVSGTTAIEYACTPPCVTRLCATDEGNSILQHLLDHSDPERLKDFSPDREGLGLLHRVAVDSSGETSRLGWLIRQLVKRGVDVNAMNPALSPSQQTTAIAYHLDNRSFLCAASLLGMGADPSLGHFDATYFAALRGNVALLRDMLGYSRSNQSKIDWKRSYHWGSTDIGGRLLAWHGTKLHMVCDLGYFEGARFFLEEGLIEVGTATADGNAPLHFAARKGRADMIDYLASMGSEVNLMTTNNCTPLHYAAECGHLEAVKSLLRLGASSSIDNSGMSPRMVAYAEGHHSIVQFLDEAFQVVDDPECRGETRAQLQKMKTAILNGDLAECKANLARGCPLDEAIPGTSGCSPLVYAVLKSQGPLIQLFVDSGASTLTPFELEGAGYYGALEYASMSEQHVSILPSLLGRHLEEASTILHLGWPLVYAISGENEGGVQLVLEHLVENSGRISQMNQVRPKDVVGQVLDQLFQYSIPRSEPARSVRMSSLHAAVLKGQVSIAELLLGHGANIDCVDELGATPLSYVSSLEMAMLLVQSGASLVPIFTESMADLCFNWGPDFLDITKLCFANGLEDTTFRVSGLLEHSAASVVAARSEGYLASILALEEMGLSSPKERCDDDELVSFLWRYRVGQSYILNSEFSLGALDPFPWHLETGRSFQTLPFLRQTFRQLLRRFGLESLKRCFNLQPHRGWSPLCRAASQSLVSVMENCLALGADIDFEGCPLGSALMIASACGRLEAVRLLVRRGAVTSYVGHRGFIDVLSIARSASVRSWLLVGRFNEQLRISTGDTDPAQTLPWAGIVQAKLRISGANVRWPDQSTLDYAINLAAFKREMRCQVAINIAELVYPDHGNMSDTARSIPTLKENTAEQRVSRGAGVGVLDGSSGETPPAMLTVNKNHEHSWASDLVPGLRHQPGHLGFVVNIQNQTDGE